LIEQVAGLAGTAAPQYKLAADAAAAVGAAVVSLNKDKVEFEQTFTFWPSAQAFSTAPDLLRGTTPLHWETTLRESRLVVLKGENENRVVPYETWYYYLWPFNLFGRATDGDSRRFEQSGTVWRNPPDSFWRWPGWFLWWTIRYPFLLVKDVFVGSGQGTSAQFSKCRPLLKKGVPADEWCLGLVGPHLVAKECGVPPPKPEVGWATCNYDSKTYGVFHVQRTAGSYGTFAQLRDKFAKYGQLIDDVTTSRGEWEAASSARVQEAFAQLGNFANFERTKKEIRTSTEQGAVLSGDDLAASNLPCAGRRQLVEEAVTKARSETVKETVAFARANQTGVVARLEQKKAQWAGTTPYAEWNCLWKRGWEATIRETAAALRAFDHPEAGSINVNPGGALTIAADPDPCAPAQDAPSCQDAAGPPAEGGG
jgi:hypothetical protein